MKALFFDIDGTLTDKKNHEIIPSVYETIRRLQQHGHMVALVTGRALYKARPVAEELGIQYIISNGGTTLAVNGVIVENRPLDRERALLICKNAVASGYGLLISFDDSINVLMPNKLFLQQAGQRKEPTNYIFQKNLDFDSIPEYHKIYLSVPQNDENKLPWLHILPSLRFEKEYLMYQYDEKDEGIRKMMLFLKQDIKNAVVFGDDINDLAMFRSEWFSIAMGNACEVLKEKADFITKKNTDDGVLYACEHFGWI